MTPEGERAYEILEWVWEAPADRLAEGQRRLGEIEAEGQAEREVGDAATMLSRLAGTLPQAGRSISAQVKEINAS